MKKNIFILIAILIGVFVLLSLLDSKSEYIAEKNLWKIDRYFSEAVKTGEVTPVGVYETVVSQYEKFIEKFPQSQLKPQAQLRIGRVFMAKKDYEEARKRLQNIFVEYPSNQNICAEAALSIGKSYEMQNNWSQAEAVYQKLIKDYPLTNIGFNMPLYIGNHYKEKKDRENAEKAFQEAVQHYQNIAIEYPQSPAELNAMFFIANAYMGQEHWGDAVQALGNILLKYPNAPMVSSAVKTMNVISLTRLQDFSRAAGIYQKFIKQHPKHSLSKVLQDMIDNFNVLQTEGIKVFPKKK